MLAITLWYGFCDIKHHKGSTEKLNLTWFQMPLNLPSHRKTGGARKVKEILTMNDRPQISEKPGRSSGHTEDLNGE